MRALSTVLALMGATGCAAVEADCDEASPLVGQWSYSGTQDTPATGSLSGTLAVTSAGCGAMIGQLDVLETDELGETRRLAGVVSGSVFANGTVRFDAELAGGTRQHLATLRGDSLVGNWAGAANGGTASGSFEGRRK
jgi:hypothetical protein